MKVAVAIITDEQQRILITQRPYHVPHGGCWEFPGGKLEHDETAETALMREIREEVGLEVLKYQHLGDIHHQYPDKNVQLIIFHIIQYTGEASCNEGQLQLKWINREDLNPQDFPAANSEIIDLIHNLQLTSMTPCT